MLAEIADREKYKDGFALDKWLRNLGLRRSRSLRHMDYEERKAALSGMDFSAPFILTGSDYDEDSYELINITSRTHYDPVLGVLEDQLIFWRYIPWGEEQKSQTLYTLSIRARQDPTQEEDELPVLLPDQIWVNGSCVFNGPINGGKDDPYRPEHWRNINRVIELSKRVKERLNPNSSARDFAKILAGGSNVENLLAQATGVGATLTGLSGKGGFNSTLTPYFLDAVSTGDDKPVFFVRDLDHLKAIHGFYYNTIERQRAMETDWQETGVSGQSGQRYLSDIEYFRDPKTGNHVFRIYGEAEEGPDGDDIPPPFDMARVEYEERAPNEFHMVSADFMENGPNRFKSYKDCLNVVGFIQKAGTSLAKREYPGFRSIAAECDLLPHINEMGIPPLLEEGGEFKWIPFFGTNIEKRIENFGNGIGGGNLFVHRARKADGTITEVKVLHDLPYEPGTSESDWDGAQPNVPDFDYLVLSHDHFDHATLEFYAYKGLLKGKPVICDERVMNIVKSRLKKLDVPRRLWPQFITYDHPHMIPTGHNQFAYPIRDEDGNIRIWAQFCKHAAEHTALTDGAMFTGCVNSDIKDTYALYGDAFDLSDDGKEFFTKGQLALEGLNGITAEDLKKAYRSPDELYIALHDPTGVMTPGRCARPEEVKDTWRECHKLLNDDEVVVHFPFSTSHLEIQAMRELWAEEGTLRNSVAVGANAQIRETILNRFGMNPKINLPDVELPFGLLPQEAYDAAFDTIADYKSTCLEKARKINEKRPNGASVAAILAKDVPYQVFSHIERVAKMQQAQGEAKPKMLFDAFFAGKPEIFEEMAQKAGFPGGDKPRTMPRVVLRALDKIVKENVLKSIQMDHNLIWDTPYWMLRSLVKNGKIRFPDNSINSYNMYLAIMAQQKKAARRATRTSDLAKKIFRRMYGKLGILSTGVTGTPEEQFSSLSRFADGDSLFDYDEEVRKSGFKLDAERMVLFVTQTPSAGEFMEKSQNALMERVAKNRNVTIFCAYKNGFKIYNPKDKKDRILQRFHELGWNCQWDGKSNQIRVQDQPFHIHGHGFFEDVVNTIKFMKAKLHEAIHIPGWQSYKYFQEAVRKGGGKCSIVKPQDHVAREYREDPQTREPFMKNTDYLTPSYWLIRLRRKYGQQYGGIVDMVLAYFMRQDGNKRTDALDVRSHDGDLFSRKTAGILIDAWLKSRRAGHSAKQRVNSPSSANIQAAGGKPQRVPAGMALRYQG